MPRNETDQEQLAQEQLAQELAAYFVTHIPALQSFAALAGAKDRVRQDGGPIQFDLEKLVSLEELERAYAFHVLHQVDGNKTQTAEILGISPATLYRRLKRWNSAENSA